MTSLQTAYRQWLTAFEPSRLSLACQRLLENLEAATAATAAANGTAAATAAASAAADAWRLHTRLQQQASLLQEPLAATQVWLALGKVAFELGHHDLARRLLESAVEHSQRSRHASAVAHWMLGCVLWKLPAYHEQAIQTWQAGLNTFELLACDPFDSRSPWYKERCAEMRLALAQVIDATSRPTSPAPATQPGVQPGTQPASAPKPPRPDAPALAPPWPTRQDSTAISPPGKTTLPSGYIEGFPVNGAIQAGNFTPISLDQAAQSHLEIQQVSIAGQPYALHSLYGSGKVLSLAPDGLYLLKVNGDSMNNLIQPGDYVLVRRQTYAESGDVVVAEIRGMDNAATLKRFVRPNANIVQLRPESSNPAHQVVEFRGENTGYAIIGKVIAVFQPGVSSSI